LKALAGIAGNKILLILNSKSPKNDNNSPRYRERAHQKGNAHFPAHQNWPHQPGNSQPALRGQRHHRQTPQKHAQKNRRQK